MLGGVGIPHVIRQENGVLLGETRGGAGREVSSGAHSECYDENTGQCFNLPN
ncbi:hypothetical protein JHK82_053164 [Glycine max]|nr:hypothetical protein JHK86_053013 [Glycine max]KAG5083004.1 hypothetical protein JHK84_053042 [Glycine max]KAG5085767.1 hypothetical protein JHK82_053164 [Glycine max]